MSLLMVMDGQGGGIGKAIIRRLRDAFGEEVEILALGTNSVATSQMMKAGANRGAYSAPFRPPIPFDSVRPFRLIPSTHSV